MPNAPTTFKIYLTSYAGKFNIVDKVISGYVEYDGVLRAESSIIKPSVVIEAPSLPVQNYARIDAFKRFYFIDNITSVGYKLWRLDMTVDVLETYKTGIKNGTGIITRTSNTSYQNKYLEDKKFPMRQTATTSYLTFPNQPFDPGQVLPINNTYVFSAVTDHYTEETETAFGIPTHYVQRVGRGCLGYNRAAFHSVVSQENANIIMHKLQDPDFITLLSHYFDKPADNIIGMHAYPFSFTTLFRTQTLNALPVYINNLNTGALGYPIIDQLNDIDFGYLHIPSHYGSYLDYAPYTRMELYLPYAGYVELPVEEVIGQRIHLVYSINLNSAKAVIQVRVPITDETTQAVHEKTIIIKECNIGNSVPIAGGSNNNIVRSILTTTSSLVAIAASSGAGAPAAAKTLTGAEEAAQTFASKKMSAIGQGLGVLAGNIPSNFHKGEFGDASMGVFCEQTAYVLITRMDKVYTGASFDDSYNFAYGKPSAANITVSDLNPSNTNPVYAEFSSIFFANNGTIKIEQATTDELDMLYRQLKDGVYIVFPQ